MLVVLWRLMLFSFPAGAQETFELIGTARISGSGLDLSGETAVLENGERVNRTGGYSALDYSGRDGIYGAMSDRGPDDGAVSYPCRVQLYEIEIRPGFEVPVRVELKRTVLFRDAKGLPLSGRSTQLRASERLGRRFDPEGFRFSRTGTMFVSDEYGPEIVEFSGEGQELRSFVLPHYLKVQRPDGDRDRENAANETGRSSNRGMEGLCCQWMASRCLD